MQSINKSIESPMNDPTVAISIILGFLAGGYYILQHPIMDVDFEILSISQIIVFLKSLLVTGGLSLASYLAQKIGGFIWKHRIVVWLRKIFKIK